MAQKRNPQDRSMRDLLSNTLSTRKTRKTIERLVVPVMPRNAFKFDPLDFWVVQFENYINLLDSDTARGVAMEALAKEAGQFADAALNVAEERWGKQRVK